MLLDPRRLLRERTDHILVQPARVQPAKLLSSRSHPGDEKRWHLEDLHPESRYIASLAAKGQDARLTLWKWSLDNF